MHALTLTPEGPRYRPDLPFAPRAGEATLALTLGGVCATDLELVRGYMGYTGVLGHEFVAVVEHAPDARWVGRRVVGEINAACGTCPTCRAGRGTHCPQRTVLGILGRDGAFSERISLPMENLHAVPDSVPDAAAVFVEPLAAALRIAAQIHVRPTDRIAVLGLGRLGQLIARVLALTGAEVTGISRSLHKRQLLPRGFQALTPDQARDLPLVDLVVDSTGSSQGLEAARALLRPAGTLVLKTTVHDLPQVNTNALVIDEITVVGSRCGPFDAALRLLATGAVDPTPLITEARPLADGVAALRRAAEPDAIKVLLQPG